MNIKEIITGFLGTIKQILVEAKSISAAVLDVALPVGGAMIASDVLLKTNFGVFNALVLLLAKVGITGNALIVLAAIGFYILLKKKA